MTLTVEYCCVVANVSWYTCANEPLESTLSSLRGLSSVSQLSVVCFAYAMASAAN